MISIAAKNMSLRFIKLQHLVEKYENAVTGRRDMLPDIEKAYKNYMMALGDYRSQSGNWNNDVMNSLSEEYGLRAERILLSNDDKMTNIFKTIGRIINIANLGDRKEYSMKEYTYPCMSVLEGHTIIFGDKRILNISSVQAVITKLLENNETFLIISHHNVFKDILRLRSNIETVKTGSDYGILGLVKNDNLGNYIKNALSFIIMNGIDLEGINDADIYNIINGTKIYRSKNS